MDEDSTEPFPVVKNSSGLSIVSGDLDLIPNVKMGDCAARGSISGFIRHPCGTYDVIILLDVAVPIVST